MHKKRVASFVSKLLVSSKRPFRSGAGFQHWLHNLEAILALPKEDLSQHNLYNTPTLKKIKYIYPQIKYKIGHPDK